MNPRGPVLAYTRPPEPARSSVTQHPDTRRTAAEREAWARGFEAGERTFYPRGWRAGARCGALWAILGAALAVLAYATWVR